MNAISGVIWRFSERVSAQLVSFVVSIVLARILLPKDYGIVAIVMIFTNIADVFANCGFATALVQKKNADKKDFSTVFYFSIVISLLLYLILFVGADFVADYYKQPLLSPIIRVMSLRIPIASLNSVQQAFVSRKLMFKKFFFATLGGTLSSAIVGIALALLGFGAWALVAQYLANAIIDSVVLWFTAKWRPTFEFSFERLKNLFSFSWKMLVSELLNTGYQQFRGLVIGKVYTGEDLAYYNRGTQFPSLIVSNINTSIGSVVFPVMSKVQDDKERLKNQVRQSIRISSYIMWPLMIGLAVMSDSVIILLLTEKWLPCSIFLKISCIIFAFEPVQTANLQAIKAIGRSDLFLKLEIIKKVTAILLVIAVMKISVLAIAVSGLGYTIFAMIINSAPNRKLLKYSFKEQILDLISPIILSTIMGAGVYFIGLVNINLIVKIVIQIIIGAVIYVGISILTKNESFLYLIDIAKTKKQDIVRKRRKKSKYNEKDDNNISE